MTTEKKIDLVLVHLGTKCPDHLIANLKIIHNNFPDIQLNLVLSEKHSAEAKAYPYLKVHEYSPSPEVDFILNRIYKDMSFRKGFWRYSMERIFALTWVHQQLPNRPIIHLESDIFIFPNFPFEKFTELTKIAWMKVDDSKDVASIIYIPSHSASRKLEQWAIAELTTVDYSTDMILLEKISAKYESEISTIPSFSAQFPKLINHKLQMTTNVKNKLNELTKHFNGIFDPAPFGMWLTGFDPRNNYGFTKYFDTEQVLLSGFYINPSAYQFEFSIYGGLRLVTDSDIVPLFSLHVHSKSRAIFSEKWMQEISRLVKESHQGKMKVTFSKRCFIQLVKSNIQDGTLLPFIFYSPPFKRIRRFYFIIKRRASA